ncbi:hypothetical protein GSI_07617 [Ganoderma sinense ZZ0214-1]|uniref:Uncharacterized protein n=1 Tax=Ganoderma sinense ZZ0214-1 TaxID=1077348 RepID=A0A2G8S9I9_9APHY|nr:hypothetical protein GSI_07617 [Ganoderma sinense ZZ0214-1]
MLEYAERRSALGCGSRSSRKRRRLLNGAFAEGESTVQLVVDQEDEELCDTRVMVFGTDSSWPEIGFKYHPDALKAILFPQSPYEGRPSKRRKLAAIADNASDTPPIEENSDDELVRQQRAVVVETLWESFLISQRGQIPSSELEGDKENASDAAASGGGRRYVIALLTNAGGTMGKLPKSTQRRRQPEQAKDVETADTAPGPIKAVPAADDPPQVNGIGTRGDVNGVAQSGGESPQKNGAPAVPGSGAGQVPGADADVDAKMSTSQDSQTHIDGAQPPESESIARTPSSSEESVDADEGSGPIQILHRDLGEENFEFALDGISVVSGEVVNGMRKGWKLEARQWKWVQVGVSS